MKRDIQQAAVAWHDGIASDFAEGYTTSPGFRERLSVWTDLIGQYVQPGDRLLDAGCGAGTLSFVAAGRASSVVGVDGSANMIALAEAERARRGLDNMRFQQAWLAALDSEDAGSFDVILCSSVLEYTADLDAEVARLSRLLRPGGRLIVSLPNRSSLYRHVEAVAYRLTGRPRYFAHVRHVLSPVAFGEKLRTLGLEPQLTRYMAKPPGPFRALTAMGDAQKTLFVVVATKA
jgi:2-polyprenyl-3-methyl-5-hydroxy-6-metoxy-1,4-benzoquinol methylase